MNNFTTKRLLFLALVAMVLAIPATASAAVGDEMLTNPGAENGSLGWNNNWWGNSPYNAAFTVSNDAHSGAHSLRVDVSGHTGGQFAGDAKWSQGPFNVVGGHYYSYSDWYKSSGNTELAVWVNTTTNPDAEGKWYNLDIGIPSSSTWAQYRSGFQMPANATQALFVHVIDDNGFLQTDDASMIDRGTTAGFSRPIVTITQDDGLPEVKNVAIPAYDAHGFKSTQYTISGVLNKPGEWTSTDIRNIDADGHEIASHSVSHNNEVTGTKIDGSPGTITPTQQLAEQRDSQATLQNILGKPVPNFAYPFGSYNNVVAGINHTYYQTGRGVESGYQSRFDTADTMHALRVQNITSPTGQPSNNVPPMSFVDFKGWVDFAIEHNLWLILVYHGVNNNPGPFDTTPTLLNQQLDYLKSTGVAVMPVRSAITEVMPQLDGAGPPVDSPPDTAITSQPPSSTTSTGATFQFTSNEFATTYECSLDNAAFITCTSPTSYSTLALGQHTFSVRATDTSNQTDATPATASWTITAAPTSPDTTITSGPIEPTTSTSASFAFTSTPFGATFQCKLDSGSYGACTSPKSYTGLSRTTHTFSVRATAAGLTDQSPATQTWTISPLPDTAPPTVTLNRPVNGNTYLVGNVVNASYTCSDAGSGIASCTGTVPSGTPINTSVPNTSATFTVNAVDKAGLTSTKTVTYRVCNRRNCR